MKNGEMLLGKVRFRVSSQFGYRIHPITKKPQGHNGVDYATYGIRCPCYAPAAGVVERTGRDQYGALFVYVRFPILKRVGLYYHLDKILVKGGQTIKAGQQIGMTGTTGRSTGVHLHFSWIVDNERALKYYEADYEDFEKYEFPRKEDLEVVKKIKIKMDGKIVEVDAIYKADEQRNYVKLNDLTPMFQIGYDAAQDMPIISKKAEFDPQKAEG